MEGEAECLRTEGTPADRWESVFIPTALASPPWICALLNFSKGGRPGRMGHSGNVSESEQRQACRRLPLTLPCRTLFSYLFPPSSASRSLSNLLLLSFTSIRTSARRKTAQSFNRRGLSASVFFLLHSSDAPLNLNPQISSHHAFLTFLVHPGFLLRSLVCHLFTILPLFYLLLDFLLFLFGRVVVLQKHLPFPGELSREGHFISFGRKLICQCEK